MGIEKKLQIKPGNHIAVLGKPDDANLPLGDQATTGADPSTADVVIAYVTNTSALDAVAGPAIQAAIDDRLAWIAYPTAGQLGTDLNRDTLAAAVIERGGRPVRQISIDDVWSALRFRPA
ncbi:MAG TPA: hypothetical protein VG369_11735 [Humibacter sp.]|nr:hypothetical protein [Humibacter sp.]